MREYEVFKVCKVLDAGITYLLYILYLLYLLLTKKKCPRRDSNPHTLRHQILSLTCLPISPRGHFWVAKVMDLRESVKAFAQKMEKSL